MPSTPPFFSASRHLVPHSARALSHSLPRPPADETEWDLIVSGEKDWSLAGYVNAFKEMA